MAIFIVLSCILLVGFLLFADNSPAGPMLQRQYPLLSYGLKLSLVPVILVTLAGCAYLIYFYRGKCNQAESTLTQLNAALESSNELLDKLANSDPLTDTLNRHGIEKLLIVDVKRAAKSGKPVIALLVDCNDFKQINERFGHDGGDAVLVEIASRLKKSSRRSDRIGRVGGDKFLLLFNDASPNDAALIAERIALAVAHPPICINDSQTTVSVSFGLSVLTDDVNSLDVVLALTKPSLQKSKISRRSKA